jgi:cation diffusion facilitator CzcD-associated flavoprotein CzcO
VRNTKVAIIGAGPYGLSVAAHLASRNVEHRIFGRPMQFWSQIAKAADARFLKSYCFGTNLSSPKQGFTFADHNLPLGLETVEPCSMSNFTAYGEWFQQKNVPWVEPVNISHVCQAGNGFDVTLTNGERFGANRVVVATGLAYFASLPAVLRALPAEMAMHTSDINSFDQFRGKTVAVLGCGQSALEAAALVREAGGTSKLLIREDRVIWHGRISGMKRNVFQRLRSPISGLGSGPKAWVLTNFPSLLHHLPESWRTGFTLRHLPPEGAWWLRPRVEGLVEHELNTSVVGAAEKGGKAALTLRDTRSGAERELQVDQVIAGTGYDMDIKRLTFLDSKLSGAVDLILRSPRLKGNFESSVSGLYFVGPLSAMSFGPLFRFVIGASYSARTVSAHMASQLALSPMRLEVSPAA